jgi:DNA-binding Lrp family transcriptional regulator
MKTMNDPALLAEGKKKQWDLEAIAKEVMVQPPELIERVKKLLGD